MCKRRFINTNDSARIDMVILFGAGFPTLKCAASKYASNPTLPNHIFNGRLPTSLFMTASSFASPRVCPVLGEETIPAQALFLACSSGICGLVSACPTLQALQFAYLSPCQDAQEFRPYGLAPWMIWCGGHAIPITLTLAYFPHDGALILIEFTILNRHCPLI